MPFQIGDWKKVYLFFGIICFSLGLLGFFLDNRLSLTRIAQLALTNVSRELADLGLIPSGESREVMVFNPRLRSIVLVCPESSGKSLYVAIKERIINRMGAQTQIISYPDSEREWFKSPQSGWLLNNERLLIGLDLGAGREGLTGPSILFSLSKSMTAEFINRLLNHRPELPLFKLELIAKGQTFLYKFSFGESDSSSGNLLKVIDILLDLWETGGRNLRRGNYRETFW
ncbi:MAG: hypothetical protein ACM3YE_13895 [Bacteroidota bacterium]